MKTIIFITLLSLTMCFSNPVDQQAKAPPVTPSGQQPQQPLPGQHPDTDSKAIDTKATEITAVKTETPSVSSTPEKVSTISDKAAATSPDATKPETQKPNSIPAQAEKTETKDETAKSTESQMNTAPVTPAKVETPVDNKTGNKSEASPVNVKNDTKEADNKEKPSTDKQNQTITTEKTAVVTKPTATPEADSGKIITAQSRSFDGPSFIGGIILALGLLAIGFMGFKYYKNQTERNYHTL